jgi:hypothetical protein
MSYGHCRGCGQRILWLTLTSGKNHPVDPERVESEDFEPGNTLIVVDALGPQVERIKEGESYEGLYGYISHFATCPRADDFRKQGE